MRSTWPCAVLHGLGCVWANYLAGICAVLRGCHVARVFFMVVHGVAQQEQQATRPTRSAPHTRSMVWHQPRHARMHAVTCCAALCMILHTRPRALHRAPSAQRTLFSTLKRTAQQNRRRTPSTAACQVLARPALRLQTVKHTLSRAPARQCKHCCEIVTVQLHNCDAHPPTSTRDTSHMPVKGTHGRSCLTVDKSICAVLNGCASAGVLNSWHTCVRPCLGARGRVCVTPRDS